MVLHNPNNWHWVDKNCIQWSREYFARELVGVAAEKGDVSAKVTSVRSVEGDVDVCQRKGKVISLFDLHLELDYSGKLADDTEVSGRIKVPEVAYDTEEDEFQFNISIDNESAEKAPIKQLVREEIVPQLRKKLGRFGTDLIDTHGKDIQHPEHAAASGSSSSSQTAAQQAAGQAGGANKAGSDVTGSAAYNTTTLKVNPVFTASAEQLYQVFLDKQRVAAWTRSNPEITAEEGTDYSLFNGNISGRIEKLVENERIDMSWRLRDWKPGHYAKLSMVFDQGSGDTTLRVSWDGVPVGQEEIVENNFQNYYVKPIMLTFGYGLP